MQKQKKPDYEIQKMAWKTVFKFNSYEEAASQKDLLIANKVKVPLFKIRRKEGHYGAADVFILKEGFPIKRRVEDEYREVEEVVVNNDE